MKIQLVTKSKKYAPLQDVVSETSTLDSALFFDEFDITIIDLTDSRIWQNKGENYNTINDISHFRSLSYLISSSKNCSIIVLLPENIYFDYSEKIYSNNGYYYSIQLKDMLEEFQAILHELGLVAIVLEHGRSTTSISGRKIMGDFVFECYDKEESATKSISGETTTLHRDNLYVTTLQLDTKDTLFAYLKTLGLIHEKEKAPDWFLELEMFDDKKQKELIEACEVRIAKEEAIISEAKDKLDENENLKSIVYTQEEELVEVVAQILDDIFKSNISEFEDEKKEDFRFDYKGELVIGEIKGVSSNVNTYHISQTLNHKTRYEADHPDDSRNKIPLLIINPQRTRSLVERDSIHDDVIKMAELNQVRIMLTETLLKLYEQYKESRLSADSIYMIIKDNRGLIKFP